MSTQQLIDNFTTLDTEDDSPRAQYIREQFYTTFRKSVMWGIRNHYITLED